MKQISAIILIILITISCQNSTNEEKQIKILQQAATHQFFENEQIIGKIRDVINRSANIGQDEKYLNDAKRILQKRSQCIELSFDSISVRSENKLNLYHNYLTTNDKNSHNYPILNDKNTINLWYRVLLIAGKEHDIISDYAAKICIREIHCYFGPPRLYDFFAPDSIKKQKYNYLIFKRVNKDFPNINQYSLSKLQIFRNNKLINLPLEITKVDDTTIFRFTPTLKGQYTIKAFQKCEEKYEWSVNWDEDVTFDFEVH